jgi:hypothetical protein
MSWLSIGSEDLSNRPEVKAGDRVRHVTRDVIYAVEIGKDLLGRESNELQFGRADEDSFLVGVRGKLLPDWEHLQ